MLQRLKNSLRNFLHLLVFSTKCHCTSTWRWSFRWNCSGSHLTSAIIFWISSIITSVVNPGKIVTSKSIGSPKFEPILWVRVFPNTIYFCLSKAWTCSGLMPPKHSTEKDAGFGFHNSTSSVTHWRWFSPHKLVSVTVLVDNISALIPAAQKNRIRIM